MKSLAAIITLTVIWHAASSSHWYCDDLACPSDYSVYVRQSAEMDIYEAGNCFTDRVERYAVFKAYCAAMCARKACVHFIGGTDGCLLLRVGMLPWTGNTALYRGPRSEPAFYEVARGKPVVASSVQPQSSDFNWEPENANDGNTSNDLHFFHSNVKTTMDLNPHLQIDLGNCYCVYKISFLPRIETKAFWVASERGKNLTIYVGSTEVTDGNYAGVYEQLLFIESQNVTEPGQLGWLHVEAPTPKCGRYLVVKKEHTPSNESFIPLEITEIEVYTENL